MSHHWRSHVGRADVIQGAGDHDVEYFGGWIVSAALDAGDRAGAVAFPDLMAPIPAA